MAREQEQTILEVTHNPVIADADRYRCLMDSLFPRLTPVSSLLQVLSFTNFMKLPFQRGSQNPIRRRAHKCKITALRTKYPVYYNSLEQQKESSLINDER